MQKNNLEMKNPMLFMTSIKKHFSEKESLSVIMIIIIMVTIMMIVKPNYLSSSNIMVMAKVLAVTSLVGMSQMIVISCGGMNLSVGAVGGLSAILAGWMMQVAGLSTLATIIITILLGAVLGSINGFLIYRAGGVGVAFFLITLATASFFTGINLTITEGRPYHHIPDMFIKIGNTELFGLPTSIFITLIIAAGLYYMYKYTNIGKQILAYGDNPKASELYGISKIKVLLMVNIIASVLAATAGMLVIMRIRAAQPDIGSDWMLLSFAAPLIGGTRLTGGKVNVLGVVLGAIVLTIVTNALVQLKVDVYWNELINGTIILLAVSIDRLRSLRAK